MVKVKTYFLFLGGVNSTVCEGCWHRLGKIIYDSSESEALRAWNFPSNFHILWHRSGTKCKITWKIQSSRPEWPIPWLFAQKVKFREHGRVSVIAEGSNVCSVHPSMSKAGKSARLCGSTLQTSTTIDCWPYNMLGTEASSGSERKH